MMLNFVFNLIGHRELSGLVLEKDDKNIQCLNNQVNLQIKYCPAPSMK